MKQFINQSLLLLALLLLAMVSCSGNQSVSNSDSTFEVNGIYYKVIRTYRAESADTDRIILTLERDIGGKPDREPKTLEVNDDELTTTEGQLQVDVDT